MDEAGRNRLWEKYIASHDSEIREQLIVEYAQLVKLVAGRMNMYLGYNVDICQFKDKRCDSRSDS